MASLPKPTPRRPRGLPKPYVGMWLLLLVLSVSYLAGVALKPELMAEILPPTRITDPEDNEGQRSSARALADADALRQELERSRTELATARAELAARASPPASAAEPAPATAAPARPEPTSKPEPKTAAAQRAVDKVKAARQAATDAKSETKTAQAATAAPFMQPGRVINSQPPAEAVQITTGSIASPATPAAVPAFGTTVKPARPEPGGPHAVQLASGPSLDALRLSWVLLTERHGGSLKGLEPRYVTGNDPGGQAFDLMAGPLPSAEKAAEVCAALKAKKVACAVGPFSGNAL